MTRNQNRFSPSASMGAYFARFPWVLHTTGIISVLVFVGYLLFRIGFTAEGSDPVAFWILLLAESFSFVTLILFFYDAWSIPPLRTPHPINVSTDIVIATYDEDISILEPTIVSSLRVDDARNVWVLDDGNRREIADLCAQLGARYVARTENSHAKAGNINHALPLIDAELVLFLDADHVPAREIISSMSGYFADPLVAVVQSPHGFRNRDSSQHRDRTRHEQSLFYEVLMPAREKSQTSFWSGSAAIIRKSALDEVGGVATETLAEDLHTTLKIQQSGYLVRYHNRVMVSALAPHTTADYLLQRDRWARGTLQVMLSPQSPLFGRGWKLSQRLHYLNNFLYYFIPFQRLAYVFVLVAVFTLGWLPIGRVDWFFIGLLLLNLAFTTLSSVLFSRGKRDAFDGSQYTWLSAAIHLKALIDVVRKKRTPFAVTPKVATQLSFLEKVSVLRLPLIITSTLVAVWMFAAAKLLSESLGWHLFPAWPPGISDPLAFWWATFFLVLELATLERLLRREFDRKNVRKLWRFSVKIPATVNSKPATLTDIHESGCAFESAEKLCEPGVTVPFSFHAHDSHQLDHEVRGWFTALRSFTVDQTVVTAGQVKWASDADRWEAQDLCYARLAITEDRRTRIRF